MVSRVLAGQSVRSLDQVVSESVGWFEVPGTATEPADPRVTYLDAVNAALEDELATDQRVVLLGEDIGRMGGAFRATKGLFELFGADRVIDTPMSEIGIVGAAIGMAIAGFRPIVELQFADFISCAYDQLVTEAAKLYYRFGVAVPMVVRAPSGGGIGAGPFHSQNPEGIFAHVPGLKIVCPWAVQDAYDLLRAAVADPNPVLFFEHKALYRSLKGDLAKGGPVESLGSATVRRHGADVSVVTYGGLVGRCIDAADLLAAEGISVEVVDLRTIQPLDVETVVASVRRTSRLVVVHEDTLSFGVGAEVVARVSEQALMDLDAPIVRVAAPDTPVPFAEPLERAFVPSTERIAREIRQCRSF